MAVVNLETKAPPTDKSVLGRNYLLAETVDIEVAVKNLQFELRVRAEREAASDAIKARHAQLAADIHAEIEKIEQEANDAAKEPL